MDNQDEGNLLLSLGVGELDDGRGDDDVVDVVPVVPVVSVVPSIPVIAPVAVIPVVIVATTSNHDHSAGIK